jgi:type II secretory pathway predicted ATPase ExeA
MERSFFNLKDNPFAMSMPPHRLFRSRGYLGGMQKIAYSIEGRSGIVALLAPRGTGKTTLVHAYLDQRQQRNLQTVWLSGLSCTFATVLHRLCAPFHVQVSGDVKATLRALYLALRRASNSGRRPVLIIDEAESLPVKVLQDLFVLADMEDRYGKLLTIILVGEPMLDQHLKRICSQTQRGQGYRRIRLEPLRRQESIAYVQHRIAQATTDTAAMFTPRALRRVTRYARGNPGLLNYVCNEALRTAILEHQKPITKSIVQAVLNDLEGRRPLFTWRWGLAALAGLLLIAGVSSGAFPFEQLWSQPHLTSMVTELIDKIKAQPSKVTQGDAQPELESPTAAVDAERVQVRDQAPAMAARVAATSETPRSQAKSEPKPHRTDPQHDLIAQASLLCLTARPPGNHARDIILVDYHGKVQRRLVSDGALNLSPILSPDRRHLAYTSYREGTPSIYLRDLKNAKDIRLTSRSGIALPGAWSPDGRYLALSKSENGNSDIFLYDLKRRHMRRLTSHPGIDISPSFAPDNQRVVFTSNRSGSLQLYLTDVGGRAPKRLTEQGNYHAAPTWSPQGGWIAFIGRSSNQALELYVIKDNGTAMHQLTTSGSAVEEAPTWSPDGQSILYTRIHHDIRERRIVDLDGRNDRVLPGHGQVCYSPQWVAQLTN